MSLTSAIIEKLRRRISEVTRRGRLRFFSPLVNDGNSFIAAECPGISLVRKGEGEGRWLRVGSSRLPMPDSLSRNP